MNLIQRDRQSVWHPFTQQSSALSSIPLERGEGACFYDPEGKRYIDAIASWWVNIHGHCHPYLTSKIHEQLKTLEHAIFSGFTHEPAVQLSERLLRRLPPNQEKIFYSDNGSTAVEVALKMAFQYWSNTGNPKHKVIAYEDAYHGDTFGGMSVGARNAFNNPFSKLLFDVIRIPVPLKGREDDALSKLEAALEQNDIASFIFEPLVQGAAGMIMYDAAALDKMIALCKEKEVICIADEVMTGFGRTGKFFASDFLSQQPDIICLSKGLTGGVMPLGVTSCAAFIHEAFISNDKMKTFFHGHSYTANPTACSAALASLDLFDQRDVFADINRIEARHKEFTVSIGSHKALRDVRQTGSIIAFEVNTAEATHYLNNLAEKISSFFLKRGIILRPLGNVIYILPPYCISDDELNEIYAAIREFLDELTL
jgi:adenosylmethionine-8-amino-7-oxononanoate aminotransferase